jgi:hypothetical protein
MEKARLVYLAVKRSAISYGAALWHRLVEKLQKKHRGPAAKLQKHQNSRLRQVLGAFKATHIRQLETEAYVPPLDLWLKGRIARFQARLEKTGLARQIKDVCAAARAQLRIRQRQGQGQTTSTPATARKQWVEKWIGQPVEQWDEREKPKVLQNWRARWAESSRKAEQVI